VVLVLDSQESGDSDFSVPVHPFTHEGRMLYKVVAKLPGDSSDELVDDTLILLKDFGA
jgi:hypothetical protein